MVDWNQILYEIYSPKIGQLLVAPNSIWSNSFAKNKEGSNVHPAVIGKISTCKTNCRIVPGTSKDYSKGSCVFKIRLNLGDPSYPLSYFLIDLWMTFGKSDLISLKQGWNGIEELDDEQLKEFKQQIKFCKGIDV